MRITHEKYYIRRCIVSREGEFLVSVVHDGDGELPFFVLIFFSLADFLRLVFFFLFYQNDAVPQNNPARGT